MPNNSNPIKLNSHSHFYCSSDNIRKATISTSSTTVCFYFRILSCWCFFSKYSITSSAKTSVSRLERHHFSTILLPNATPRGWRGCSTTHPNKGYATTACVFDSLPNSTFVRGQGITQGNDLNRRQSCNGNNNKESTRWSHSWDYELSCLAFTLAEESSASLSTQLLNTSQGLHTISHTSTWKEAGKFS